MLGLSKDVHFRENFTYIPEKSSPLMFVLGLNKDLHFRENFTYIPEKTFPFKRRKISILIFFLLKQDRHLLVFSFVTECFACKAHFLASALLHT